MWRLNIQHNTAVFIVMQFTFECLYWLLLFVFVLKFSFGFSLQSNAFSLKKKQKLDGKSVGRWLRRNSWKCFRYLYQWMTTNSHHFIQNIKIKSIFSVNTKIATWAFVLVSVRGKQETAVCLCLFIYHQRENDFAHFGASHKLSFDVSHSCWQWKKLQHNMQIVSHANSNQHNLLLLNCSRNNLYRIGCTM